jgi:type VI secretion system Hcp family effector
MAFAAYLQLDGIPGECTEAVHGEWIELVSYNLGADNTSSVDSKSGGVGAGKASFKKLVIEKQSDKASPLLFLTCGSGGTIANATLDIVKSPATEAYLQFQFETVVVNSIVNQGSEASRAGSEAADQDDYQIERVEFSFGKLTWTYKEQASDGSLGGATEKFVNIVENTWG